MRHAAARSRRALTATLIAAALLSIGAGPKRLPDPTDPPVLAHYYIWYQASSWNRAKSDYPAIGRYTSDLESVAREHIMMAKSAGIDGFIVSWKSTEQLNARLATLVALAEELDFKLAITYQALDFNRDPLPVARIGDDLDMFVAQFGDSRAFDLFGAPVIVWTGTEQYSTADLRAVSGPRRDRLLFLATEKSVDGYERVAQHVDGELYYWSSVNPMRHPAYPEKLIAMGRAVHARGDLWIAPVSPGYDARLLGGTAFVDRADGAVLRETWEGAMASSPSALGVISWNEFSENTHIEPSRAHGNEYLRIVAGLTQSPLPPALEAANMDSSAPGTAPVQGLAQLTALGLMAVLLVVSLIVVARRNRSSRVPQT